MPNPAATSGTVTSKNLVAATYAILIRCDSVNTACSFTFLNQLQAPDLALVVSSLFCSANLLVLRVTQLSEQQPSSGTQPISI